jgi:aspartate racemase
MDNPPRNIMNNLPENVKILRDRFLKKKIWYNITPNLEAKSCSDAVNKRNRLGYIGIPIFDELKSNLGYFFDQEGNKVKVVLHCRGNQDLDICDNDDSDCAVYSHKVNTILSARFYRLCPEELKNEFGLEFGLVNPFSGIPEDILQIFDKSVFETYHAPFTMMTNAGHFEWGLEFRPEELPRIIGNYKIEDIVISKPKLNYKNHTIGILTGNGPDSGIMLWQQINENVRDRLKKQNYFRGDLSFPKILVESIPEMGLSMELELRDAETRETVLSSVRNLCERGATLIGIACNTTQYYQEEIRSVCNKYEAVFISIPSVIEDYLQKKGIEEFDFLGIKYVADFEKWSGFKGLDKKYKVKIPSNNNLNEISRIAFLQKQEGVNEKGRNNLRTLIDKATKTNTIIIALTEISVLLASQKKKPTKGKIYIDTLSLLASELASLYVTGIHETLHGKKPKKNIYLNGGK